MLLLNKSDIQSVFSMKEAIEVVKEAFRLFSAGGTENPLRTNLRITKNEGTLLFMPAYAESKDCASLKIINLYPGNLEKGIPTSFAQVILMDTETGEIVGILDGTYVTQLRTGAASGACFDLLAKKDAKIGALIGTGGQAETQLEAMLAVRDLEEVRIFDSAPERAEGFVERMQKRFADNPVRISAVPTSDEAVCDADLLITVTPSKKPVFDASKCKPGITVSCVGAYQPDMQEMDPQILVKADKIYFDAKEAVLEESGDIIIPMRRGMITARNFTGELGEVILGTVAGRETDKETIVFETVGIGTQDLLTAKAIYEKASSKGIGTIWNT